MTPKPRGQTMAGLFWKYSLLTVLVAFVLGWVMFSSRDATGGPLRAWCGRCSHAAVHESPAGECDMCNGIAGTWYWLRSPDEEKRAVIGLYNRYCIRCHGVDGRGVWDIPDVPNFTEPPLADKPFRQPIGEDYCRRTGCSNAAVPRHPVAGGSVRYGTLSENLRARHGDLASCTGQGGETSGAVASGAETVERRAQHQDAASP